VLENVEIFLFVRVAVGHVFAHPLLGKCAGGFLVKDRRIVVGFGLSDGCPRFPAGTAARVRMY